jgi:hypothetical protein
MRSYGAHFGRLHRRSHWRSRTAAGVGGLHRHRASVHRGCDGAGALSNGGASSGRSLTQLGRALILEVIRALSHRLRTRLFAAVLLLPLIALATATGGAGLRCRITGEVSSACCCDGGADASAVATVSAADCCDRVVRDVTTAPAELSAASGLLAHAAPVAFVAVAAHVLTPSVFLPRSEARSRTGPPTVRLRLVSKSSFLI